MAPAPDYGSTIGALLFAHEVALLFYFVARSAHDAVRDRTREALQPPSVDPDDLADDHLDADTRFLFDIVARRNESIVQNLDALDNGLIAVTVAIIAVTLFAADKWFDLDPIFRLTGFFFLLESAAIALLGYLTTYFAEPRSVDDVALRNFAKDFFQSAAGATASAITDIVRSAERNAIARRLKRAFVILATALAMIGAMVLVTGRAFGGLPGH